MWYAVETVFIDGVLFGSQCCFKEGDNSPVGHCYSSEKEPKNSCKKEFNDRIEIHVDWFESEELAKDFRDGKITYIHTYDAYYKPSIKSMLRRFHSRQIVKVDVDSGILPHRGICRDHVLESRPFWV